MWVGCEPEGSSPLPTQQKIINGNDNVVSLNFGQRAALAA